MRLRWSRIPRGPLLAFLLLLAGPAWWVREEPLSWAVAGMALAAVLTSGVWNAKPEIPPGATAEEWRALVQEPGTAAGCMSGAFVLLVLVPAWMLGWAIAGRLEFAVPFLHVLTAVTIAAVDYVALLFSFAFLLETGPPAVPEHLRAELSERPRALGVAGAGDAREIAPGFVADLNPDAPPAPATGSVAAMPAAPLRRVLRLPEVAPWKAASERRLRVGAWRSVAGPRFFLGAAIVAGMIAGAIRLHAWRGGALAILAAVAVAAAALVRAMRWEWPGEVSLADWFRSERSLVKTQQQLATLSNVLVVGSGLVIAGEATWNAARVGGKHDLLCGAPLVMLAASIGLPLAWRFTLRRSIGQPPAVRSVPEPIRQAVLAVAKRREEVVARNAESEEVSVVEDLAGVPVAPDPAEGPVPPAPAAPAGAGALAREAPERILAELSRAASLRPDGAQLVRRVEIRLGEGKPSPADTDLLVEVAELLFLAFPDRAAALVGALGEALEKA